MFTVFRICSKINIHDTVPSLCLHSPSETLSGTGFLCIYPMACPIEIRTFR
jgi:hypothetical protein